jgi:hypothetical protein
MIALMKDLKEALLAKASPARIPDFLGVTESIGFRSMGAQPPFEVACDIMKSLSVSTAFSTINWPISDLGSAQP